MNNRLTRDLLPPPEEAARRLQREGLSVRYGAVGMLERHLRHFTVTVLELEATDIRRIQAAETAKRDVLRVEPDDRLRRIVARAAVRAVYVLGLNSGQVEVAEDGRGRADICRVSDERHPSPGEGEKRTTHASELLAGTLARETAAGVNAILGADPEFVLVAPDGRVVAASRYLPLDGSAGCDSVVRRGIKVWPLVELRPEPSPEPAELTARLRSLLAAAARRIGRQPLTWLAGALPVRGLPLGGHIHVSGAALTSDRLRALDHAVALPLRLLEPPLASARRPRYGALGDFRRQPHGGFEYRTPPSWLVSQRLARGALALAKIAVEHAAELGAVRPLADEAVRDAFYGSGGESVLREAAVQVYERLRQTDGFRKYEADADFVFRAVLEGRHWDETADIRAKWGIQAGRF